MAAPTIAIWALRLMWLAVALIGGSAVGEALEARSDAVQIAGTAGAWIGWAVGALAVAVPATATLTVARAVVPGALAVAVASSGAGATVTAVFGLVLPALLASVVVGAAETGRAFVQSSAYGNEQRFLLRPPIGYLIATVGTWLVMALAALVAPLAWAARAWPVAVLATVVVVFGALTLPRRWHVLSRRWLVLVPAGVVLHDPIVLADTLLLRRRDVARIRLARVSTEAADLTGPTPGPVLEITTNVALTATLAPTSRTQKGRAVHLTSLLAAPTRPGAALDECARRGLPVG